MARIRIEKKVELRKSEAGATGHVEYLMAGYITTQNLRRVGQNILFEPETVAGMKNWETEAWAFLEQAKFKGQASKT